MFERYTDPAKRVLFFARYEASEFGALAIEPEHLLLGLLREPAGALQQLVSTPPAAVDRIVAETRQRMHAREKISTSVEIPFSRPAQVALVYAAEEADRLTHATIRPVHLLLGLLHEEGTIAASVLHAHGLRLDDVRQRILVLETHATAADGPAARVERIRTLVAQLVEVDDVADRIALRARIDALLDEL
jgi:ATP-dependent Clp protease ATP-binding subunit ClpC